MNHVVRNRPGFVRAVLMTLLAATAIRVWVGAPAWDVPAQAQIPDSGLQRKLMLEELRTANQLLGEIRDILATRSIHVRIEGADKPLDKPAPAPSGG